VLLRDEATSRLDAESERMVQQAMNRRLRTRTTLITAHRLATIQSAERIVVVEHGRVQATGAHQKPVERRGRHARQAAWHFVRR
jgi:ATP-binding cassette subfamily B protein